MRSMQERRRLRLAALGSVVFLTVWVGYDIAGTPPTYAESATVILSLPDPQNAEQVYTRFAPPLIMSTEAMAQSLMSPQDQRQIAESGGTASVDLQLVNLYDSEYPDYGEPMATLTATSPSAENAQENVRWTFRVAVRRLRRLLATLQAKAGVPPGYRIKAQIIADSGPVVQPASLKRALAGLLLLTLAAVGGLWKLIDKLNSGKNPVPAASVPAGRRPAAQEPADPSSA
jgi:hypothetical protein